MWLLSFFIFYFALTNNHAVDLHVNPDVIDSEKTKPSSCTILARNLLYNESRTTSLFYLQRSDGMGAEMQSVIHAVAYSFYRGWNFLGFQEYKWQHNPHGIQERDYMNFFWGDGRLLEYSQYPDTKPVMAHLAESVDVDKFQGGKNVAYFIDKNKFDLDKIAILSKLPIERYFSPLFLSTIRAVVACQVQTSLNKTYLFGNHHKRLTVAAHIRRGDVDAHETYRYVPDELFLSVLTAIRKMYPYADIHAFTSTLMTPTLQQKHNDELLTLQNKFKAHNFTLHVTDESSANNAEQSMNTVAHFITADVFVMSKSSFSSVPAYYNPNCVIHVPFWWSSLSHYINLPKNVSDIEGAVRTVETQLPACISALPKRNAK